jgi:methylated-DNA-protein-cysteine methyltransferase-like protein
VADTTSFEDRAAELVRRVPAGRVASYGQIAAMAGDPRGAREVVKVLRAVKGLPWHRIISGKGVISLPGEGGRIQRGLLEKEGVELDPSGAIDLGRFGWRGP